MKKITLIIAIIFAFQSIGSADDGKDAQSTKNYCHSPENKKEFDDLLAKHSSDTGIIKLYALREGLCAMIDHGQITLDEGIDIWELERSKIVIERTNDELGTKQKLYP